jgi:Arc/MetJ family transcription regulator
VGEGRPKVIARLPFIERPGHPAGTPVFCISKPLADAAVRDVVLYAARLERWREAVRPALRALDGEVVASAGAAGGLSALVAVRGTHPREAVEAALREAGVGPGSLDEVGGHAERFVVG